MSFTDNLLSIVPDGKVLEVHIGLHWTAVIVEVNGQKCCGLASTLVDTHEHTGHPQVPLAGKLETLPALELAGLIKEENVTLHSVGMATINALLPNYPDHWTDINAGDVIASYGKNKKVVLIGNFPFISKVKEQVGELLILEQNPKEGELPAKEASSVIPNADVVAITGMTLVNGTFSGIFDLCSQKSTILVLGPSTPLTPWMFEQGIHLLSGSVVTNNDAVIRAISQGASFRQVHKFGVRLVTMCKPGFQPTKQS